MKVMQNNNVAKIICTSMVLVGIFILSTNINSILAKSQNPMVVDSVVVHLDKTDYFLGDYMVMIKNIDTGKYIDNVYTDYKDSFRNVDIPGILKLNIGQTLTACVIQIETKEVACDTNIAQDSNTEFNINMADRVSIESNGGNTNEFNGTSSVYANNDNNYSAQPSSYLDPSSMNA